MGTLSQVRGRVPLSMIDIEKYLFSAYVNKPIFRQATCKIFLSMKSSCFQQSLLFVVIFVEIITTGNQRKL